MKKIVLVLSGLLLIGSLSIVAAEDEKCNHFFLRLYDPNVLKARALHRLLICRDRKLDNEKIKKDVTAIEDFFNALDIHGIYHPDFSVKRENEMLALKYNLGFGIGAVEFQKYPFEEVKITTYSDQSISKIKKLCESLPYSYEFNKTSIYKSFKSTAYIESLLEKKYDEYSRVDDAQGQAQNE